eukprot:6208433-Pleurochrysis_carterae.AAC.6
MGACVSAAFPHSISPSAKRALLAEAGRCGGRAGMCRRSEACVRRAGMRGRGDARSSSRVNRSRSGNEASNALSLSAPRCATL